MKRRWVALLLAGMMCLSLAACGSTANDSGDESVQMAEPLTEEEVKKMYSNPKDYVGSTVELVGQIFGGVEYDDDGVYFQMYADPANWDMNTMVGYLNPDITLEDDAYVKLTGIVTDVYEGENMLGATLVLPAVRAIELEEISYIDAVVPTICTAAATTPTIDQRGYAVTVEKVELAEDETRVYVKVVNNGANEFSLYDFNMTLIQNGSQYEKSYNFDGDYPELQTDIRPGITTEGIVTFPGIAQEPFQIIMEGRSGDWQEDLSEYTFDFTIQQQ